MLTLQLWWMSSPPTPGPSIPPVAGRAWVQTGGVSYVMTLLATAGFTFCEPPTTPGMSQEGYGTYLPISEKEDMCMEA